MKPKIFSASQFTPTQWDSAEQKAKFANQFVRFVESDFKNTLFPNWFYNRLSMTFGHIAHYNQLGFYETFFTTTADKVEFLAISAGERGLYALPPRGLGPCGDPAFTYCDVERELMGWVTKNELLKKYRQLLSVEREMGERTELERLQHKYT